MKKGFDFKVEERVMRVDEFIELRNSTDWGSIPKSVAESALSQTVYGVVAYHNSSLAGAGRIIGDGALYYYIQDLIVIPAYQGKGLGSILLAHMNTFIDKHAANGAFIGLMAANDTEAFYVKHGYSARHSNAPGMYRIK